jgi:hypothetical protein
MNLKTIMSYIGAATVIAGLITAIALHAGLPKRVDKVENDVDRWAEVSIEQKVLISELKDNQRLLIENQIKER